MTNQRQTGLIDMDAKRAFTRRRRGSAALQSQIERAFSLLELMVVIAVIATVVGLLLPVVSEGRGRAQRTTCLNNLHQINMATRMYAEDHDDAVVLPKRAPYRSTDYQLYKEYVKSYAGYKGLPSPSEKLFACPCDTFYWSRGNGSGSYHSPGFCAQRFTDFTSYAFNGGNRNGTNYPGIAGLRLTAVHAPARTLFIFEAAAMAPFSWHKPKKPPNDYRCLNSMNMVSYVDGHVNNLRMYFDTNTEGEAWQINPPANYDYQWSAD